MNRWALIVFATTMMALSSAPAFAQTARTFVSGLGSDMNPCSRTAPCRSFGQAISVTAAGGEVVALDSAGYGPFTITKAISITAQGVEAAIATSSGDGITINAGASDIVNLRALTLTGAGGANGITFNSGGTLNIQHCAVSGFSSNGLNLLPTTASTINVSDTIASANGSYGILVQTQSGGGTINAVFDRVRAIGNGFYGVAAGGDGPALHAIVVDSLVSGGTNYGFETYSNSTLMIVNSESSQNLIGLSGSATMLVAGSRIFANSVSYDNQGTIKTFGDNDFANNGAPQGNSLTPIGQQ